MLHFVGVTNKTNYITIFSPIFFASLQEADLGFNLIIDRRKDRWNSVKAVLLKISVRFFFCLRQMIKLFFHFLLAGLFSRNCTRCLCDSSGWILSESYFGGGWIFFFRI